MQQKNIWLAWSLLRYAGVNKFWFDYIINTAALQQVAFSYFFVFKVTDKGVLEYSIIHTVTTFSRLVKYQIAELQQYLSFGIVLNMLIFNLVCFFVAIYC